MKFKGRAANPSFFMAGGIAASLLLLAFVLQAVVPAGRAIAEKLPTPDFSVFLPAGSTQTDAVLEISDMPQPSYVVSFVRGGTAGLELVNWDRDSARYVAGGSLVLAESAAIALDRVDAMSLQPLGLGTDTVLVRGTSGAEAEAAFLVSRDKEGLRIVRSTTEEGLPGPAFFRFPMGDTASDLTFEDADGDGRKEAVLTTTVAHSDSGLESVTRAYRWDGQVLAYDADLSRVLSLSRSLFPTP